jgi:hypothetical protein
MADDGPGRNDASIVFPSCSSRDSISPLRERARARAAFVRAA